MFKKAVVVSLLGLLAWTTGAKCAADAEPDRAKSPLDELPSQHHPALETATGRPHEFLERRQLLESLADEIVRLPDRERKVLELYYTEGLNMKEVGAVLGVTESRVCQLHAQAAARLRVSLNARLHAAPASRSTGERR